MKKEMVNMTGKRDMKAAIMVSRNKCIGGVGTARYPLLLPVQHGWIAMPLWNLHDEEE